LLLESYRFGDMAMINKQKREYREGEKARKSFEKTMKALFRAPKVDSKKSPKGKD
jgi:hypothetical protein